MKSMVHATRWAVSGRRRREQMAYKVCSLSKRCTSDAICDGDTSAQIFRACAKGDASAVVKLLSENRELAEERDKDGYSLLHIAVLNNTIEVVDALIRFKIDMNAVDPKGDTALHLAVEACNLKMVKRLIECPSTDGSISNNGDWRPIHKCIVAATPEILEALLQYPRKVDVDSRGKFNGTALHFAVKCNRVEFVKVLLRHGCHPNIMSDIGTTPSLMGCRDAANGESLELLLEYASKTTNPETGEKFLTEILNTCDIEGNFPIHSAILSGSCKLVEVCLKYGSPMDKTVQDKKDTPFHMAAAQGTLPVLQLLVTTAGPEEAGRLLRLEDNHGMTPLHRAASFDHCATVEYLCDQASHYGLQKCELDAQDELGRTPLMLSIMRKGIASARALMSRGVNKLLKDKHGRNVIHYAVLFICEDFDDVYAEMCQCPVKRQVLNETDNDGQTALHLAAKGGRFRLVDKLLSLDADLAATNNKRHTAIHLAAMNGRVTTLRQLVDSKHGKASLNERDACGANTALHMAAKNGHEKVIELLLQHGAVINKNLAGATPLHLAAAQGELPSMKLLLRYHPYLLDLLDHSQNSPLHYAAKNNQPVACRYLLGADCRYTPNAEGDHPFDIALERRHTDVARMIVMDKRWETILHCANRTFGCPVMGCIIQLPEIHEFVLNRCHTKSELDRHEKGYWENYNFGLLETKPEHIGTQFASDHKYLGSPLPALNLMVKHGRVGLLQHPVCTEYLQAKWHTYGQLSNLLSLLIYVLYLLCITTTIVLNTDSLLQQLQSEGNDTILYVNDGETKFALGFIPSELIVAYIVIFSIGSMLKELLQLYYHRIDYFSDAVNYIEWSLYITSLIFASPLLVQGPVSSIQWKCGAISVFLAWWTLLQYLERFGMMGIYVVMFQQILKRMLRVVVIFSSLLLGFGFTFHILLINDKDRSFGRPVMAITHAIMMTMGEFDFVDTWVEPYYEGRLQWPPLQFFFLILFVIVMPLLFMNLLIGLAVGDIQQVLKDATLQRLAMQVKYYTQVEERFPLWLKKKFKLTDVTKYPNDDKFQGRGAKACAAVSRFLKKLMNASVCDMSEISDTGSCNQRLVAEIRNAKAKLEAVETKLDRQNEMLRLIVQNLKIPVSAELLEEGKSFDQESEAPTPGMAVPMGRRNVLQRAFSVVEAEDKAPTHATVVEMTPLVPNHK